MAVATFVGGAAGLLITSFGGPAVAAGMVAGGLGAGIESYLSRDSAAEALAACVIGQRWGVRSDG